MSCRIISRIGFFVAIQTPVVAIVIDSSLSLFLAWDDVRDHLLERFLEANPPFMQPRVGFITYGTPGSDGCPVLVSRFFAEGAHQLKENPDKFKVGHSHTVAGSSTGMFALEGCAAAIEMIDTFRNRVNREIFSYHLWHCTAEQPDDAQHPPWNKFRTLTWETLPVELEKRDIEYSIIAVQPSPIFGLSSANLDMPMTPWFSTFPIHTIPLPRFTPSPGLGSNDQWMGMLELRHMDDPPLQVQVVTEEPCGDLLALTWPKALSLELVQSTVSITEFQAWMRKGMKNTIAPPVMVRFLPASGTDRHNLSELVKLLRDNGCISTASWLIQGNDRLSKNLVLRPCLHDGAPALLGVAFPVSGMRGLPPQA